MVMPDLAPVIAIVGDDPFLQAQAVAEAVAQAGPDAQRIDYDGSAAKPADVFDELQSFSMFGGFKLAVMRDADDFLSAHREKLERYCEQPSTSSCLVLRLASLPKNQRIHKIITKTGKVIECTPPKAWEVSKWVVNRCKFHGRTIAPDAAQMLSDLIGPDLARLDSELSKLALQASGPTITAAEVRAGVAYQRDLEMWEMTDALSEGKREEAVRRWRHLSAADPSAVFRAVPWLANWLDQTARAFALSRQRMGADAIAKALRTWPGNAERMIRAGERIGEAGLRDAVSRLVEVDRRNKSSLGEPSENVERFLLTMGR